MQALVLSACLLCAILSLYDFALCFLDKQAAKKKKSRIPERRLLLLCALGGGPGLYAGMYLFHHKTKHMRFVILAPLCAFLQIGLLIFGILYTGLFLV